MLKTGGVAGGLLTYFILGKEEEAAISAQPSLN